MGLIFVLTISESVSHAQKAASGKMRKDANGNEYSSELPNLKAYVISETWVHPTEKKFEIDFNINVPRATGDARLDQIFKDVADNQKQEGILEATADDGVEFCRQGKMCHSAFGRKFMAFAPSSDILSVSYFYYFMSHGAIHPITEYESFVYDVKNGRELELKDIFTDYDYSLPLLWKKTVDAFCALSGAQRPQEKQIPTFYKIPDQLRSCSKSSSVPVPEELRGPDAFEALGHAYLTPDGISLRLTKWEANSEEEPIIRIGKKELMEMGAKSEIWGGK
jgi:hypothetical protein